MISNALQEESKAVGLGMNQMLRNLGSAIGPVIAATVMTSYSVSVGRFSLPSATAFNTIFGISTGLMVMILVVGLATKNYVFRLEEALATAAASNMGPIFLASRPPFL